MRPLTCLTLLLAFSTFFSCKKSSQSSTNTGNGTLPKTYTEDVINPIQGETVVTFNLTYDANGRLLSLISTPAPPILSFVYKYPDAKTVTLDMTSNSSGGPVHENFMLNSFGLVDSTIQYDQVGDTTTEKYQYNGSHQPIQVNQYYYVGGVITPYSTNNYTFDNNGNAISQIDGQGDTTVNTFDLSLQNNMTMGKLFYYQNKNLVKTSTFTSNATSYTATHYYTFDSSNRLIKDSAATSGNNGIVIKSYTY